MIFFQFLCQQTARKLIVVESDLERAEERIEEYTKYVK